MAHLPFPMSEYYHRWSDRSTAKHNLSLVSKLCPKVIRNIETYLKISNSIEIREPLKTRILQRISIIFCALRFSAASYTR